LSCCFNNINVPYSTISLFTQISLRVSVHPHVTVPAAVPAPPLSLSASSTLPFHRRAGPPAPLSSASVPRTSKQDNVWQAHFSSDAHPCSSSLVVDAAEWRQRSEGHVIITAISCETSLPWWQCWNWRCSRMWRTLCRCALHAQRGLAEHPGDTGQTRNVTNVSY